MGYFHRRFYFVLFLNHAMQGLQGNWSLRHRGRSIWDFTRIIQQTSLVRAAVESRQTRPRVSRRLSAARFSRGQGVVESNGNHEPGRLFVALRVPNRVPLRCRSRPRARRLRTNVVVDDGQRRPPRRRGAVPGLEKHHVFGHDGPSAHLSRDGTRETASSFISLMNYLDSYNSSLGRSFFRETRTAYFHAGTWTQLAPYTFGDGTHQPPLDGPPPPDTLHHLHPGMEAVGYILCVAIVGLSFGFGGWTYHNRKAKVVRASQPIFLYIICVGTAFIGASIIPLTLGPEDGPCQAFPWMLSIGFSLTFSALFTKTYRIKKVMQSAAKFKRLKLTARDVMKPMIALLILNVIILTLWTVIDPQKKRVIDVGPVDDFGYAASTYSVCFSEHASIFIAALGVVNLGSVAFALVQAYQARNISTEYSESSYIFRAMAIILYGSFLGAPVLVISGPNIEAYYFVWVGLIFILASSIDVLIFLPKIRTMRKQKENGTPERPQWQRGEDGATRDKTEEKESGIIIYSSKNEVIKKENQRLKKENQELKHLLTLSKNQQLDRVSSVVNRDITK